VDVSSWWGGGKDEGDWYFLPFLTMTPITYEKDEFTGVKIDFGLLTAVTVRNQWEHSTEVKARLLLRTLKAKKSLALD